MNPSTSRLTAEPPLPRLVWWFGLVSLATDASGEMIYPLLPLFLTVVLRASAASLGFIEGAAEATASLLKLISGKLADRAQRRKPLTVAGYGISSLARPLAGLATAPWMILVVRLTDRTGKGIRTSPRDALLADATSPQNRGRAYGLHRAMDNVGAVIGPLVAALLLIGHFTLREVFLFAIVPGLLAMAALVFGVRERPRESAPAQAAPSVAAAETPPGFGRYLFALGVFSLGNSTDAFLLWRASQLGVTEKLIPILWMMHNAIKALLSTKGGALSDRLGRRRVIVWGWAVYGLTYLGFGLAHQTWQIWVLFALYAVYYSLAEGSEKALVADLVGAGARGWGFGRYYLVVGMVALPASFGFGALVNRFGALLPFTAAAALALLAALLLWTTVPEPRGAAAKPAARPA